jgi:hypothetical protein
LVEESFDFYGLLYIEPEGAGCSKALAVHGHFLLHYFTGAVYTLIADVHVFLAGNEDAHLVAGFATKRTMYGGVFSHKTCKGSYLAAMGVRYGLLSNVSGLWGTNRDGKQMRVIRRFSNHSARILVQRAIAFRNHELKPIFDT